ncbi:MAG: cyanophycinase [Phycisphaerales bacterium]
MLHATFVLVIVGLIGSPSVAADETAPTAIDDAIDSGNQRLFVRPIPGALVLPSDGTVHPAVIDAFLYLTRSSSPTIVVVGDAAGTPTDQQWADRGARTVLRVAANGGLGSTRTAADDERLLQLLSADGIWFAADAPAFDSIPLLRRIIDVHLDRGRVVGGHGAAARRRLPNTAFHAWDEVPELQPGTLHWEMEPSTAIVAYAGRRLMGYGSGGMRVHLHNGSASPRVQELNSVDEFDTVDPLSWSMDLMALQRQARAHSNDAAAGTRASATSAPTIAGGTLFLHGGSGVDDATFERFIAAAGGRSAAFVCLPVARSFDPDAPVESYSASKLRDFGCDDVTILHTHDPHVADRDPRFLAALDRATGVWIDGGRTFRAMDALQSTQAAGRIAKILAGGGAVGGSSAGAQVAGELLVRGDPRTNQVLLFDGYTQGLGLLPGVVVDAHFRQRNRGEAFGALVEEHPALLGIGIDERTAIIVQGGVAEVAGSNAITFYDARPNAVSGSEELSAGQRYDMVNRRRLP